MTEDEKLREELVFQLLKGNAHMSFDEAVADFPEQKMNERFSNGEYTFWHLLEHIRRTQNDIIDFMLHPDYVEREWPKDYWPEKDQEASKEDWEKSIIEYVTDREKITELINDTSKDLYEKLAHGTGQTILRKIMVIIDHTAYHVGEFAIMRQVGNAWNKEH